MELEKMLKSVNNLNDYISITQELVNRSSKKLNIHFNMSSVLMIKKVRSLEIEYFNKCEGNGAALVLFDRMVEQPASKTWGLLGKELVALLQYWLDAMRKHLIKHSHHWWSFLKLLLKFIQNMRVKDKSLPDTLVEGTAECLLDLATSSVPDTAQRHEILYCLNLCCAESSREIRFALRTGLEIYFKKLASLLASCGHLPAQYSMLEALMRWLLPRHEASVRQEAATKWFPPDVCCRKAVQVFLARPWQNFFQDARDFLNAFNSTGNLVSSFLCRKVTVGATVIVSGTEKRETWLDLNSWDSSASVVLDPRLLDASVAWESLRVPASETITVELCRVASDVTLVIHTTQAPRLCPSDAVMSDGCEFRVAVSPSADLRHLDRVLRDIFEQKYQLLLDLDKPPTLSLQDQNESKKINSSMEEETRFSHPVEVQKRKRSGYMVRSRNPIAWKSPSTASTTSLAQLHDKLASLPLYKFDKEAVHVCALPELSTVTEVSETDDRQSLHSTSTFKINRPVGVCYKSNKSSDRNSQSDGEVHIKPKVGRYLSPTAKDDDHSTSCLLLATIGSDESIINDTLERLTKNKDFQPDNIVDLLVQEALQKNINDKDLRDSGINTGENRKTQEPSHNEIVNTEVETVKEDIAQNKSASAKTCTVISNTTTDESNDVVYDTPLNFVNIRKRTFKAKVSKENVTQKTDEGQLFDVKEVEEFFSRHLSENNRGEIVISPTLARKINETSSESEQFEDCLMIRQEEQNVEQIDEQIGVYDIDIIECLNSMVDKVCSDLDKCAELMQRDTTAIKISNSTDIITVNNPAEKSQFPLKDVSNIETKVISNDAETEEFKTTQVNPKRNIKLTYNIKKPVKTRANARKKKTKLELESASNMSPIKEVNDTVPIAPILKSPERTTKTSSNESVDLDTPIIRRKRKLYSPKDEGSNEKVVQVTEMDEDKDFKSSKVQTPKYKATSYKDIEMDRQKRLRQPRSRKSRAKSESPLSPRTKKKNDIFNQLKEKVECPDTIMVIDKKTMEKDLAVYNFTSDSDDEDFKKKKIEVQKRISSTTIASGDSSMSTRHGRLINRINYTETKSSDESNKINAPKQKRKVKRMRQPKTRLVKPVKDIIDEKMRDAAPDELNTSLIIEQSFKDKAEEPKLILPVNPQMEPIPDGVTEDKTSEKPKKPVKKNKKTDALSLKKENNAKLNTLVIERDNDDRTISPLPGLIVEAMPAAKDDANDSVSANMLQKFKKIYQDGPEAYINESNTTQNLLSDVERINYSPPPMNITDELNNAGNYSKLSDISNEVYKVPSKSPKQNTNQIETVIDLSVNCYSKIESSQILHIKKEKGLAAKKERKIKRGKNKTPEIINLTKISDANSEVSIATVGNSPITAHGDSDELPPNSELLTENIKPRDLDVEYLDQSVKDYFDKLREDVMPPNNSRQKSIESSSTRILDDAQSKSRSPVVSIARMSLEDITKWLPSRRNSDTDSNSSTTTKTKHNIRNVKEALESTSDPVSNNDNSTVQKIDKISLEFDFESNHGNRQKLKSTNKKHKEDTHQSPIQLPNNDSDECLEEIKTKKTKERKKTKINKNVDLKEIKKASNSTKWLRSRGDCVDVFENAENSISKSISPVRNTNATPKKSKNVQPPQMNRKSLISPIKLFDDFKYDTPTTLKKIESVISNLEEELKRNSEDPNPKSRKEGEISSTDSKVIPAKVSKVSRPKRKSNSPVISSVKKRKLEETVVSLSDSGPSVSSVNDWFRRNAPVSRAENVNASFRENIENVMEKLDTTLIEIHQNTSKKFIHMFVDAQKHLNSLKQERRDMYKSVASDILAQVVKVIDEKFADLDRRSQQMDVQFMEQLKIQASALIREDCKKKQAMVSLLREDLSATLARMDKR